MKMVYDVAIVGGGVIGAAVAYELSKYRLKTVVLERETDIAEGTTKANSGIVHAGYDPEPGTWMARCNVRGAQMMEELCGRLSVHYRKCGSLVLAFSEEDQKTVQKLYERGKKNGVPGLEVIDGEEVRKREPNVSEQVLCALFAPTGAIVNPWELCIALADTAKKNGVDFWLDSEVTAITRDENIYTLHTGKGAVRANYVINAAGVHADRVQQMVGEKEFSIIPIRGEYYMLDKNQGDLVNTVVFQCPGKEGKGVLVSPTVHGNLIVGPNAEEIPDGDDVATTRRGLAFVKQAAARSVAVINYRDAIRNFAGVRAHSDQEDFVIGPSKSAGHFINLAGIKSPGLTSAPAIAEVCVEILQREGMRLDQKQDYEDTRKVVRVKELSLEQKQAAVRENPLYGRVICRCETITEGEIVDAIHSPIPACTVDGVKKRCNAGLGRCQGGFCGPRVAEIISRELSIPMEEVLLNKKGTRILTGETKQNEI